MIYSVINERIPVHVTYAPKSLVARDFRLRIAQVLSLNRLQANPVPIRTNNWCKGQSFVQNPRIRVFIFIPS